MVCPLYRECPLLRDSNCIILIGRLKFGDLVLSIIERYLIQCPLFGVSIKRDSTVYIQNSTKKSALKKKVDQADRSPIPGRPDKGGFSVETDGST